MRGGRFLTITDLARAVLVALSPLELFSEGVKVSDCEFCDHWNGRRVALPLDLRPLE